MTTTATPAANDAPKPDTTATPAPAANTPAPAATDKGQAAPSATDPKTTGTATPTSDPAPADDAGDDADDGDDSLYGDDGDEPASTPAKEGEAKPTAAEWRDGALKAAEQKWLAKAKTDDDKKAVADRVSRMKAQIGRYGTVEAAMIALADAQDKLRSKQDTEPLQKDASPEERAEWREKQGLPKDAKDIAIPRIEVTTETGERKYHEWTEADKPLHDAFREVAFDLNLSQAQVDKLVGWQYKSAQERIEASKEQLKALDKDAKRAARTELREEWGNEYDARIAVVERFIKDEEALPDGAGKLLWDARDPTTGHRLAFHPSIMKLIANAAQDKYGEGAFISGDAKAAIADEEEKIVNIMKNDFDKYIREGWDKKLMAVRERKGGKGKRAA